MASEPYKDRNGASWIIVDSSDGSTFFGTADPETAFTDGKIRYDPVPGDTSLHNNPATVKAEIEAFAVAHKGDIVLRVQAPGTPARPVWPWILILGAIAYESMKRKRR